MNKIFFVGHDATRTGAPIVLLNLLRWLRANASVEFRLLLVAGGELESEFAKLSKVSVLSSVADVKDNIIKRGLRRYGFRRSNSDKYLARLKRELIDEGVNLIYSNTATNGHVVAHLAEIGCPVITHVHELEYALRCGIPRERVRLTIEKNSHYIAASESVRKNLIENHSIPKDKIDLAYGFIHMRMTNSERKNAVRAKVRQELGVPDDDFIVGACGVPCWLKGADLFVQLASIMSRRRGDRPVWFVWLGGPLNGEMYHQLCHDIKLLGLENSVKFIGPREDAVKYIGAFDVFVLTSREESFSLVCLEAASMEVPIVYFDKIGGVCELFGADSGFIVPYLDLPSMANQVSTLLNSEELRSRYGRRAAQKTRQLYDVNVGAPRIFEIIRRFTQAQ
jgi:glycosyltransferase involved in cell wall biosynthesis